MRMYTLKRKQDDWARVKICGVDGETKYEMLLCAHCADEVIRMIEGKGEADD